MKKTVLVLALLICAFSFHAFKMFQGSEQIAKKLGIPEAYVKDLIWSSFSGMYLSNPGSNSLRKIPANERGSFTLEVAKFAKAYAASEEFKKKYLEDRENRKPAPPEKPKPMAQQKKEAKEDLQKSISETEATMKALPADQKEMFRGTIDILKQQLKSYDDPNNMMFSADLERMQQQGYDMQMQEYKERLTQWEKENPLTPNRMIKRWLTEFLEVSKDVDFAAALVPIEGGKMMFAKTVYERKPDTWKMCFRAGKQTVEAGRSFASQWLGELDKEK